jgi:hypothetical protein
MPPKQPDPQRELNILLQRARRNSRNPLLVKVVDWTGNPVQSVLLADADDWIRSRLQGMTAQLSDYLHSPQVIVVASMEDPAAGVGELTRAIMLECGTHHLVVIRNSEGGVNHIALRRLEDLPPPRIIKERRT